MKDTEDEDVVIFERDRYGNVIYFHNNDPFKSVEDSGEASCSENY